MFEETQEQTKSSAPTKEKPEEKAAGEKSTEPEPSEARDEGFGGGLFSPAIIVLFIAIGIDLIGVMLLLVGLDDFFVTDIIGTLFVGSWMFFRSGSIRTKGSQIGKGKWLKFLPIFEFIPYIGSLPFWSITVYRELKNG